MRYTSFSQQQQEPLFFSRDKLSFNFTIEFIMSSHHQYARSVCFVVIFLHFYYGFDQRDSIVHLFYFLGIFTVMGWLDLWQSLCFLVQCPCQPCPCSGKIKIKMKVIAILLLLVCWPWFVFFWKREKQEHRKIETDMMWWHQYHSVERESWLGDAVTMMIMMRLKLIEVNGYATLLNALHNFWLL